MEGKAGGTFLGIIDTIVRGENLLISCNGGRGGDGSDGLDGIQLIENSKNINVIHLGFGGKGGKGGNHGEIKFYFLNDSINLNIKKSTRNGVDGKSGTNGIIQITHDFQSIYRIDYYVEHVKKLTPKRRIENFHLITNNFITTVTNYRKYVIDTTIKNGKIIHGNLYKKLNNVILLQNITVINFLQELIDIEYYYYSVELNETVKNLLYTGIQEGIALYKREIKIIDTEYRTLLSRLYDMTWRKVNEFDNTAIVNIQVYLEQSIENGEKLKNFQIRQKLQEIGNNFKAIFEEEIKEAEKLIDMNLKIYLDERINDLNNEIPKLVNEIDEMITMKKGEIEKLRNIKKELNGKLILRSIFTIFQFLLLGLSFINPVCAAIAGVLSAGIVIADEIILDNDDDVIYNEIKLPEAVNEFVDTSILLYAELVQQELNIIQEQLNEIKNKKNELSLNDEEAKPLIDVDKSVNSQCIKNSRQPISRRQCMMKILKRKEIKWSKKDNDKKNRKYKKSLNIIKSSMGSLEIVNLSIDRFNKHFNDISSSNQIDGQIIEQENNIKQLENFKNNLYENFGNQIDRIRWDIRRNVDGYAISSRALLEYEKFQMHDFLNNILIKLNIWTKGFKVNDEITEIMEKIKNALNSIINMHNLIREYNMKIKNADFLKDAASVPYEINYIKNKKLLQNVTKLEEIYTSNRIIDDYNKLKIAMKCYSYPFIKEFTDFITPPPVNNALIKANIIVDKLKQLKLNLNKKIGSGILFKQIKKRKFGNNGTKSFYKWTNKENSLAIKNILQGKKVQLFANISQAENLNAVKFREIKIILTSSNFEINEKLQNILNEYEIFFHHNGDSYYRCRNKVHLIKSGSFGTLHQFDISRIRRRRFVSDDNNNGNDFILSPYATWTIQIYSDNNDNDFYPLEQFVDNVNVELVGEGQFMPADENICNNYFLDNYRNEMQFY